MMSVAHSMIAQAALFAVSVACAAGACAQALDTTLPRRGLDGAEGNGCAAVSAIMTHCAPGSIDSSVSPTDELTKSRARARAGFERDARRSAAEALSGRTPGADRQVGDAQVLDRVTVTGSAERKASVEEVLQRALRPASDGVSNGNGTVTHYGVNGTRFECVEKCFGPLCCVALRVLPDPAREVTNIGR